MKTRIFRLAAAATAMVCATGADWNQFRGADNTGVSADKAPPFTWGKDTGGVERNVAWKVPLTGRGVSGPIVVGDRVFLTAASGLMQDQLIKEDRLMVLAYDAATGKQLWQRQFWATGRTLCHPTSSVAAPTPASDGQRIFAFFSSNDLICLDLDGNLKWLRGLTHDYPTAANDVGMAASPVVIGDTVVVQVENLGDSFAAGIDTANGQTRWRVDRPKDMNWSSPSVVRGEDGQDLVVLQSPTLLSAHDPQTGEQVWSLSQGSSPIPSAVGADGLVLAPIGSGLTAFKQMPGEEPEAVWTLPSGPGNASPAVYKGKVYTLSRTVLTCADLATGVEEWPLRLKGRNFWASPLIADDHMFLINEDGLAQIIKLGEKGTVIAENDLGEPVLSSPAAANGALYVRGEKNLWKIAAE